MPEDKIISQLHTGKCGYQIILCPLSEGRKPDPYSVGVFGCVVCFLMCGYGQEIICMRFSRVWILQIPFSVND